MLIASGAIPGTLLYASSRGFDWNTVKPVWLLQLEAESRHPAAVDAALSALLNRQANGDLSTAAEQNLVQRALAIQADRNAPWNYRWGDLVAGARMGGRLADSDWRRFAHQAVSFQLEVRPVMVRGDPLVARMIVDERTTKHQLLVMQMKRLSTRLSNQSVNLGTQARTGFLAQTALPSQPGTSIPLLQQVLRRHLEIVLGGAISSTPIDVSPGIHALSTRWSVVIGDGGFSPETPTFHVSTPLYETEIELMCSVEILDRGQDTVAIVEDESLRTVYEQSIQIHAIEAVPTDLFQAATNVFGKGSNAAQLSGQISFGPVPMECAFDVLVVEGDREHFVGHVVSSESWRFHRAVNEFRAESVHVILRPSTAAARTTIDLNRIWGGEIRFENVPVHWKAAQPTRPMMLEPTPPSFRPPKFFDFDDWLKSI